jgi:hypothetical protein
MFGGRLELHGGTEGRREGVVLDWLKPVLLPCCSKGGQSAVLLRPGGATQAKRRDRLPKQDSKAPCAELALDASGSSSHSDSNVATLGRCKSQGSRQRSRF